MSFYSDEYLPDPEAKRKHFWKYFADLEGPLLDIGCTTGNFLQWNPAAACGVDIDLRALAIGRRRGLRVCCADVSSGLAFADGVFLGVSCSAVLEHVAEPLRLLREIRRVLHPEGRAIVLVPDIRRLGFDYWKDYTHRTPFTREGLFQIACDAGFVRFSIDRYAFNYLKHLPGSRLPSIRQRLDLLERGLALFFSKDLVLTIDPAMPAHR